jgi:3-hydroxyacyl-[acyl-carrier-protein] dehydratase
MTLDIVEIQKLLPHRYPFLMVDAIVEVERLKRIVGIKNVSVNEYYFQGHFPGKPVMPGVLILEAVAQTGGLLLLLDIPDRENKLLYFVAVDGARFRRPVVPGDQLRIEVKVLNWRGDFCKLEGKATVNGQLAAEGTVMCKMIDRHPPGKAEEPAK